MIQPIKALFSRFLSLIALILLATIWVLVDARPVIAQDKTINYTFSDLQQQDFSHKDLKGGVFAAANMREANFEESDLSYGILTEAVLLRANLKNFMI